MDDAHVVLGLVPKDLRAFARLGVPVLESSIPKIFDRAAGIRTAA
jgi:hypothetical protein